MTLNFESYVFDPRPEYPLVSTINRYPAPPDLYAEDGVTLVFGHGTGFHKELWEPTLEDLFEVQRKNGGDFKVREAWSVDSPNHGEAGVLNEEKLLSGCYDQVFSGDEYARALHAFLAGLGKLTSQGREVSVDFTQRTLVGIGHSIGAAALLLTQTYYPRVPFFSFVLIDPMVIARKHENRVRMAGGQVATLDRGAEKRRNVWTSKQDALDFFSSRPSWKIWDERILKIYVEHGLRDIPAADPEGRTGVTLKCTKAQEAASFRDKIGRERAYDLLSVVCRRVPVHLAWGAVDDYIPLWIKDDVENVGAQGRFASVSSIPGAGHLAPQVNPQGVANAIWASFIKLPTVGSNFGGISGPSFMYL